MTCNQRRINNLSEIDSPRMSLNDVDSDHIRMLTAQASERSIQRSKSTVLEYLKQLGMDNLSASQRAEDIIQVEF